MRMQNIGALAPTATVPIQIRNVNCHANAPPQKAAIRDLPNSTETSQLTVQVNRVLNAYSSPLYSEIGWPGIIVEMACL